ncbi:histidine-rich glycoprotein-like [Neltuma alba]|uniref:histidine-rich glycoprotein-like n=1 Tax=Neltuma alba TaxID=207710 RepID=UPI0010A30B1C|nr:histidine-rich glycoprotein-like [Prosopis alba]
MAAGFASFTVFFCLLYFSTLSTAVDLPAVDQTKHDPFPESHKNSDEVNAISLPSERSESESATVIRSQPEISNSKISEAESEVETFKLTESSEASDSVPITTITFRPLNRHMPWRPMPFPFHHGHRCRHNHKFKPWNPRIPHHQIPYGNDMILSNGEEKDSDVLPDDRVPKIPTRWTRFGRFESRFTDEPVMETSEEVMMRPRHHHHDHEHEHDHDHHHDHDHEHDHDHHHDHDHEHDHEHDHHHNQFYERDHEHGALMKSIRKFLQHF